MKHWYVGAECLLQFSDNPPAGSPLLHLHQSARSHTPPWSVQGQSLNPAALSPFQQLLAFEQNFQSQWKYPTAEGVWLKTEDVWKCCTCLNFIPPGWLKLRSYNVQNKCKLSICFQMFLSEFQCLLCSLPCRQDMQMNRCSHREKNRRKDLLRLPLHRMHLPTKRHKPPRGVSIEGVT